MTADIARIDTRQWQKTRLIILERDGYICGYCGGEANEVDHIIPRDKGGTNEHSNLVAACKLCNGTKSNLIGSRVNYYNKNWISKL